MNEYGVLITQNGKTVKVHRHLDEEGAEKVYQENKGGDLGVVKFKVEKAHEPYIFSTS